MVVASASSLERRHDSSC